METMKNSKNHHPLGIKLNVKSFTKNFAQFLIIFSVLIIGRCSHLPNPFRKSIPIIKNITTEEAVALLEKNKENPKFIILDIRRPEEYSGGHLEKAFNLDYYSDTFLDSLRVLDKKMAYLIYCRSGNRSGRALDVMAQLEFKEVYNILGGFRKWQEENYSWTK